MTLIETILCNGTLYVYNLTQVLLQFNQSVPCRNQYHEIVKTSFQIYSAPSGSILLMKRALINLKSTAR